MITIVYSTHKDQDYNNKFRQHLLQTVDVKNVNILEYQNNNEYSLAEIYNKGLKESTTDIVVFCHNDIKLEKGWGKKLLNDFFNNPEFGIIGKAGSSYMSESGVYWERMWQTMAGQVYHHPPGSKKFLSQYSPKTPNIIEVSTIDGLFIAIDKTKIKHTFDETIGKFHFYDHGFCVPNYIDGVKIGVTSSFEITHESVGRPDQEFFESKDIFVEKYKDYLPIDLKPTKLYVPTIKRKPIKNSGKVAIIILTKGKVEMLYNCVKSFYDNCDSEYFDVFIADTGSSEEEKMMIKNRILGLGNVKLIEYDYYNFAKINNDVVRNHLIGDYEFLLFSNNDIKILNDVIYGMLKIFKENKKIGTVGGRLHYQDNTVQHCGMLIGVDKQNNLKLSHKFLDNYNNFTLKNDDVIGNTGALMMIKQNVFKNIGMFNENYNECFEDIELNIKCIINGLTNVMCGELVAYHYESQTRNDDTEKTNNEISDFKNTLLPFLKLNFKKLTKYVVNLN
jgi:GT2 family glycosyltransferase